MAEVQKIFHCGKKFKKMSNRQLNISLAAIILAHIKNYTYLHSGPLLADAIIKSIAVGVPGI
jgi:hypothetical protein